MYLPGMGPAPAKIVIKPRTSWRDRDAVKSAQSASVLEKPVEKKAQPYHSWRDNLKKPSTDSVEKPILKKVEDKPPTVVLDPKREAAQAVLPVEEPVAKPADGPVTPVEEPVAPMDAGKLKKKKTKEKKSKSKKDALPPVDHSEDDRHIQELKDRLTAIELEKQVEIKVIQEEVHRTKLEMRRSANKEEADTIDEHMKCKS